MKNELSPGQRALEFLYSIGLPPIRILRGLIILFFLSALFAGLYFFAFTDLESSEQPSKEETIASEPVEQPERKTYEFELTLDQQIDELLYFDTSSLGYVVLISEIQKQDEKIKELRQRSDLTPQQTRDLDRVQLRNLQLLVSKSLESGISAEAETKAFNAFATSLVNGNDASLGDTAAYSITKTSVVAFGIDPSGSKATDVIESLNTYSVSFVNKPQRANELLGMLSKIQSRNSENGDVMRCIETIGQLFAGSKDEQVLVLARNIREYSLFAKFSIQNLERRIRYQAKEALADFDGALRVLEAHPEVSLDIWKLLLRCNEASISNKRQQDFRTGYTIISDLISKLPDSDERKPELMQMLVRQQKRSELIGQSFDITGETANGQKIRPLASGYSLVILADRSPQAVDLLGELNSRDQSNRMYRPIVAFKDKFTEVDRGKLDLIPPSIYVASEATAERYITELSTDFYPYMILLDKQGVIVEANLSLVQVANRIATLESKAKKQ